MKFSKNVSSQRRISRKKYYKGNSEAKRKYMSSRINKNFLKSLPTKSIPIRKGDEVKVSRGSQKGKIGKIVGNVRFVFELCLPNWQYFKKATIIFCQMRLYYEEWLGRAAVKSGLSW